MAVFNGVEDIWVAILLGGEDIWVAAPAYMLAAWLRGLEGQVASSPMIEFVFGLVVCFSKELTHGFSKTCAPAKGF